MNNPKNVAMGLGRSVHIEAGPNVEYRLAQRWSAIAGVTSTHFSNGGTQRPNNGLNQAGPSSSLKYDVGPAGHGARPPHMTSIPTRAGI